MQLGESRPAREGLGRGGAVDGRDAADGTFRVLVLRVLYSHRRDVDGAREALENANVAVIRARRKKFGSISLTMSETNAPWLKGRTFPVEKGILSFFKRYALVFRSGQFTLIFCV